MKIQNMFRKDIERDINGVIKVMQDDDRSLEQELSEYIITKELRRHFRTFFDNYTKAIDQPTDKIGVWISGFFGSGKSHFLKILSYLLSNQEVCGKRAIDYFADKFDDPMMYAQAVKSVSVPTQSILFNIDIEGPLTKDRTAVLRVFAKMFYNHCGFYGDDLKIAKLERFIEKQGKTQQFREAFEKVNGAPWTETRDSFAFFEDDIVSVLQSTLGMSEQAARNWFNGEETNELNEIFQFAKQFCSAIFIRLFPTLSVVCSVVTLWTNQGLSALVGTGIHRNTALMFQTVTISSPSAMMTTSTMTSPGVL